MGKWWNVDDDGVLTIYADTYIKEKADGILPTAITQPWLVIYEEEEYFTKIIFVGKGLEFPKISSCWFEDYSSATEIIGLELVSTKNVTDMNSMFSNMQSLKKLDVSNFDTRKVTNMSYMFYGMESLKKLDLSNFDTSKVKDMSSMFDGTLSLKKIKFK